MPQPAQLVTTRAKTDPELVGSLHSELHLVLQTRHSQLLVRGRNVKGKPTIIGLLGFADRLRLIWQASEENDPYADWWLLKVHDSLAATDARIATDVRQLRERMGTGRTLQIAPAAVKDPFRMALRFSTAYAFRAARTLGDFDELVCLAFTAKHVGVLPVQQTHSIVRGCAKRIRAVFNLPLTYRRLGIQRGGNGADQPAMQRAEDLMGVLPDDIAKGRRRAPLAPPIRGKQAVEVPPLTTTTDADSVVFD